MSIKKLHTQVLLAMVVGCVLGLMFKNFDSNIFFVFKLITMLGTMFINLLKMVMVPLIFSSIIIGVSSIKSGKRVSQIGFKTFLYYVGTSLCAIIIGLSLSKNSLCSISAKPFFLIMQLPADHDQQRYQC